MIWGEHFSKFIFLRVNRIETCRHEGDKRNAVLV